MILRNKYLPVGLDWGHTALRGVQLLRRSRSRRGDDSRFVIHAALERPLPVDCVESLEPDIVADLQEQADQGEKQFQSLLQQFYDRGGFIGCEVVLHCPAEKMDMRPVKLPAPRGGLPRPAILGALRLQLADHITESVEQVVLDYLPLDHDLDKGQLTVMAFTSDSSWINRRIDLLHGIGLHCVAVLPHPNVLARLIAPHPPLRPVDPDEQTSSDSKIPIIYKPPNGADRQNEDDRDAGEEILNGILDIGYSGSTLIVCSHRGPLLCRRFPLGGRELIETLTKRLMINAPQAEKLIRTYGIDARPRRLRFSNSEGDEAALAVAQKRDVDQNDEIAKTIFAALQLELSDYVEGLIRTLNYVITEYQHTRLEKILLCGAGGLTRNLAPYMAEEFELPVEHLTHPLLPQIVEQLPATRCNAGGWLTALGLSLAAEE